jgi:geranylgeranyl reductase family protein
LTTQSSCHSYDVVIVGSGPAGSTAANFLASNGIEVLIVEKASLPRHKTCGGGVVYRAIQQIPDDINGCIEKKCFITEVNVLDINKKIVTQRSNPIVTMTMRKNFDFSLLSIAVKNGAIIEHNCEVVDVAIQKDSVNLKTNRGDFFAKFVIAADGVMSTIAKKTNWDNSHLLIPALECEVSVSNDIFRRFSQASRFDFGIIPNGYAWVFPKRRHLSIGVLSMCRGAVKLNELFRKYLKAIGIDHVDKIERHGYLIPVRPRTPPFAQKRVLLTGDAAGFADPVTAEGISFAIQSGRIAAQAILDGNFDAVRTMRMYDAEIERQILPELQSGSILAVLLYDHPKLRTLLINLYGKKLTEMITDVFMGEKTYNEILQIPLNHYKVRLSDFIDNPGYKTRQI